MNPEFQRRSTSVLVVDDDPAISRLIRFNLENADTQVIEVATGSDGVRILHESRVDLMLLDLGLPDSDGWSILDHVRETEMICDLPVIVVSAEPPDRKLIEQFKLNDYVQKPFDVRDLVLRVRNVIGLRDAIKCAS